MLPVASASFWTDPFGSKTLKRPAGLSYPPDPTGGNAGYHRILGDILSDHRAGSNGSPGTNRHGSDADGTGTNGCAPSNRNPYRIPVVVALERSVNVNCPGEKVVSQHGCRTDEDAISQTRGLIYESVVLDLAVLAQNDVRAHIRATTNVAAGAKNCAFANLSEMPNRAFFANARSGRHISAGFNSNHGIPPDMCSSPNTPSLLRRNHA